MRVRQKAYGLSRDDKLTSTKGFTFDSILSLIQSTALNPWLTLPIYTYSIYNDRGKALAAERPLLARYLKSFAILSIMRRISKYLDMGIPNNWTNDTYNWSREVVVVTGGSDGIGAIVVQLLAERGVKVVVLDIQAPKYDCM
jgi:all-trans-retinol dehydrogenase (NAD+)